ncbi:MAG: patatin-like phospholipase family protein [Chloroflexaceae bacterium]|nr:patatin-like phospholipase family protein [Chloroflexaceae bacterium]
MRNNGAFHRSKAALVLAGGGVAGAVYEIGALCAIDELLDDFSVNDLDMYVGTSAGGLVSACLVNGITPRTLLTVLDHSVLGIEPLAPQHLFSVNLLEALNRTHRLPPAVLSLVMRLVAAREYTSLLDLIETLAVGLPTGLYDSGGLERYIRESLAQPGRTNTFAELRQTLRIIATNLDTGERAIFGEPPLDEVPISQAVSASAAIPLFYRPVRIGDQEYIDGGLRGTASLDVAIEQGAKVIVCINPMVPFDNSQHAEGGSLSEQGMQRIGNQVFRTFVHAGLHYHLKQVRRRHPDIDIILIEPRRDDAVMFSENTMSYGMRLKIACHGFVTVGKHLLEHADYYKALLSRHRINISTSRIKRSLAMLEGREDDPQAIQEALSPDAVPHVGPPNLSHTLVELERLLDRMERTSNRVTATSLVSP